MTWEGLSASPAAATLDPEVLDRVGVLVERAASTLAEALTLDLTREDAARLADDMER